MTAAVVVYVLLAALAVFQVALIAGAPLGRYAWGGQHEVLPTRLRIGSAISVLIYAWIAAVIAYSVTLLDIPAGERLADPGIWIVTAYFAVDVPLNLASR